MEKDCKTHRAILRQASAIAQRATRPHRSSPFTRRLKLLWFALGAGSSALAMALLGLAIRFC